MKKFLREIFKFSSIPLIFLVIFSLMIYYTSKVIDYKLKDDITELYIGDSHIECAVNDSLLNSGKNVSENSESFYFSYYKLKKLVEENKNIKTVYLGLSYHSLSNYYDQFTNGEFSPSVSPKYFYVLPVKEEIRLGYWNLNNFSTFIKGVLSVSYRYLFNDVAFSSGGYSNNFTNTMASKISMEKRSEFQYHTNDKLHDFSEINLLYLSKIIEFCKTNRIDLVVLSTPLHPYYKNKIPAIYIDKLNEIVNLYNLNVIDFTDLTLSDSCFIPDGDHLSVKGANQMTKELVRINQELTLKKATGSF